MCSGTSACSRSSPSTCMSRTPEPVVAFFLISYFFLPPLRLSVVLLQRLSCCGCGRAWEGLLKVISHSVWVTFLERPLKVAVHGRLGMPPVHKSEVTRRTLAWRSFHAFRRRHPLPDPLESINLELDCPTSPQDCPLPPPAPAACCVCCSCSDGVIWDAQPSYIAS